MHFSRLSKETCQKDPHAVTVRQIDIWAWLCHHEPELSWSAEVVVEHRPKLLCVEVDPRASELWSREGEESEFESCEAETKPRDSDTDLCSELPVKNVFGPVDEELIVPTDPTEELDELEEEDAAMIEGL
ncbi:uncharacterized protein G2W53_034785 [Senna tora]|uniref:Uncharacterized protein n=1 Tax=Senna tora TaxID=362788 RepID=A0A834TBF4_9FABA|nr:uncharacterized protein G2W53_034785 [Senna tora]